MKKYLFAVLAALFFVVAPLAMALEAIPDVDPLQSLLTLLRDYKVMSPIAIGVGSVILVTQLIKQFVSDSFQYKRLLVTVLAIAYGILMGFLNGLKGFDILVLVLVTGGGASALYEALKGAGLIGKKASS